MKHKFIATNRNAQRDYHLLETYEAGIKLKGSEIKSIRSGKVNISDCFARVENGEAILYNLHIAPYKYETIEKLDPKRPRKLLLHKSEINGLVGKTQAKGLALIATKLYLKKGFAKVELALARGKKLYDKREEIKRREAEREIRGSLKRGRQVSP